MEAIVAEWTGDNNIPKDTIPKTKKRMEVFFHALRAVFLPLDAYKEYAGNHEYRSDPVLS
jgi:hypothetical protein